MVVIKYEKINYDTHSFGQETIFVSDPAMFTISFYQIINSALYCGQPVRRTDEDVFDIFELKLNNLIINKHLKLPKDDGNHQYVSTFDKSIDTQSRFKHLVDIITHWVSRSTSKELINVNIIIEIKDAVDGFITYHINKEENINGVG